tara:strand:- start:179 stop:817 length:639 start_codon:yes stop_codon:yes gene_type:complete
MEIDQSIGLAETEYLKKPELPSSIPNDKVIKKKKRVVSQKQLDSLKRAREASVLKRKKIKEQKLKDKEEAKALKKKPIQVKEPEVMETIEEERADTPEELIDMNTVGGHSFNYEKVIGGVFDMIQADKERRKPEKEARWDKRFKDAEDIRIDERNKLLDLVKQMERADSMKSTTTKKEKPKPKPKVNPAKLLKGQPDWDSCFAPRRGGNNFF